MDITALNNQLKDFLIKKRAEAGLSQEDVANRSQLSGIGRTLDQRTVSRIEKKPLNFDLIKITGYLSAIGVSLTEYQDLLTSLTNPKDRIVMSNEVTLEIKELITSAQEKVAAAKAVVAQSDHIYIKELTVTDSFAQAEQVLKGLCRKPIIGFFGMFDAGKSTLINTIINSEILPASYQPATCVVNLLMHKSDRPASIWGDVAVFKKGFKPYMIHDSSLVEKFIIEQGDAEILERFGVHNYETDEESDAYIAIAFANSEILKKIWLLDTPGDLNSADTSDTQKAEGGSELADAVVYLSSVSGFMDAGDLNFGGSIIRQCPPATMDNPLAHVLIVQSFCSNENEDDNYRKVGPKAIKRLSKSNILDEAIFTPWKEDGHISATPSCQEVASRIQPFWKQNAVYREELLSKINEMADHLVSNQKAFVKKHISTSLNSVQAMLENNISRLKHKKKETTERIQEVADREARFREESKKLISEFTELIESCEDRKEQSLNDMKNFYDVQSSYEKIHSFLNRYTSAKEAQSDFSGYYGQTLTAQLETKLKTDGHAISDKVDLLLEKWQRAATNDVSTASITRDFDQNLSIEDLGFNSKAAFIGGLAGLGSLGAMACYVSTIASNLGAYILVGKVAGVLVSLGIISNVTVLTSAVAAIGGPITIGIAIAAAIGYAIYRFFSGKTWQDQLTPKIIAAIEKDNVWGKIESAINEYWDTTRTAIKAGLEGLKEETEDFLSKEKEDARVDYSPSELSHCIEILQNSSKKVS